ncbi:hypothetical protein PRIPAC_97027 [Pristionchus pacificus]|uniref:Uncharacterized protein n=1 Tax=Pristionchus pacificus TaxID=54126 RepID=A0A2A6D1P1_PRIPA|nr:hypothetical protein PRIPAC_97027 [Pristionchus pacificus]|eukprot:PDM84335.1 hypothetical protein PRIPAC_33358 [Pristionchus pacificus]
MSGWTTPSFSFPTFTAMYKTFNPDEIAGLAHLIELIVFLRQGPMSTRCLVELLQDINEGIQHTDITTFIQNNCPNLSFVIVDGIKNQNIQEITCGAYCIFVINEMLVRNKTFRSVVSTFHRIKRDDVFERKYLSRNFSFHLPSLQSY